eukprot:6202595-Heterocapsa_arctica.AAC.1
MGAVRARVGSVNGGPVRTYRIHVPGIPDSCRGGQSRHVLPNEEAPPVEALHFRVPGRLIAVGAPLGRVAVDGCQVHSDVNELARGRGDGV